MSDTLTGRPLWRQGMFMRPQHFQQLGRYVDSQIHARASVLQPAGWGLQTLTLDTSALALGKFVIQACRAIMPDGLVLTLPQGVAGANVLTVPNGTRDKLVLIGVPLSVGDGMEVAAGDSRIRFTEVTLAARDVTQSNSERQDLTIAVPNAQLFLEGDQPANFVTMPIARIADCHEGIRLDRDYIPPVLDMHASTALIGFLNELESLLKSKSRALSGESDPLRSQNYTAALIDFLMLQTCNRYLPLLDHYGRFPGTHPETFYRDLLQMAGDFSAFLAPARQPPDFAPYDHLGLMACLQPLLRMIRSALLSLETQGAIALPLQASKFGIWVSPITDRSLLDDARFILSVGADVHPEVLRSRAPSQFKVGPIEQIRELTQLQLPGIKLLPLPVVPRELPYRADAVYLQLEKSGQSWPQLRSSAAFALHVSGDYPGLRMEFWAIRDGAK
ncbi:type VI secretion system baseplate subunit TssK [Acidisoma sp. C75]